MIHAMIDLETLGVSSIAAIATIGAVAFDPTTHNKPESMFYMYVNLDSCFDIGLRADASTLAWWSQQRAAEQEEVYGHNPRTHIASALGALTQWLHLKAKPERVWAHGVTFDISLLAEAYRRCSLTVPWHYRDIRDTRGLYDIVEALCGVKVKDLFTKPADVHNALTDAALQASMVQECYARLSLLTPNGGNWR